MNPFPGHQLDVLAFDSFGVGRDQLVESRLAVPGEGGEVVAGVVKLAQRFLFRLLTIAGSMPYQPDEGSSFLVGFRENLIHTQLEAEQAFQSALVDIKRLFQAEVTDDQPLDEQLADATILSVVYLTTSVIFHIQLTSQAGTNHKLLLPLTTVG